jgi:hypothetical protein
VKNDEGMTYWMSREEFLAHQLEIFGEIEEDRGCALSRQQDEIAKGLLYEASDPPLANWPGVPTEWAFGRVWERVLRGEIDPLGIDDNESEFDEADFGDDLETKLANKDFASLTLDEIGEALHNPELLARLSRDEIDMLTSQLPLTDEEY